jgi:hypothetical protein
VQVEKRALVRFARFTTLRDKQVTPREVSIVLDRDGNNNVPVVMRGVIVPCIVVHAGWHALALRRRARGRRALRRSFVVCAASMCAASSVVVSAGSPCASSSCTGGGMHGRCVVVLGSCSGSSRAAPSLIVCCVVVCCVIGRCARGVIVPWVVVGVGGRALGHRAHRVVCMDAESSCGASPFASSCTGSLCAESPFAASCAGSSFAGSSCARGGTRWVLVRGVVAREGSWGGSDDGRNAYASLMNAHAKIGGEGGSVDGARGNRVAHPRSTAHP